MILRKNKTTKISIIILMILLLFFSFKYFSVNNEFNNYKANTDLEIKILENQLGEILHKYDSVSIDTSKNSVAIVVNNSNNILINHDNLNKNSEDSASVLNAENKKYTSNKNSKKKQTASKTKNSQLNKKANLNNLLATNINVKGVKIYSDLYKFNNSKIQQLRVCYTLEKNEVLKAGNKKMYIQVVNPKNQIISKENSITENSFGVKLQYSALSEVNYTKKDTDVCTYVDLVQNKTIKGKYIINIYNDFTKIGTTTFEYK
jgi:hypothetical protein